MNLQVIKNRLRKALAYTVSGILFVIIASFLILQIQPVQNAIIDRLLSNFSGKSSFKTSIESFQLLWFDRVELEGLTVIDPEGNEVIKVKNALINYSVVDLIHGNDINLDALILDSAQVFLTKIKVNDSTTNLNINVLINELNAMSKGSGGGRPPKINLGEAVISQSQFTYVDQYRDTIKHGFDYNHFALLIDEGELNNFMILGDTIEFDVRTLLIEDQKTKFKVNQLSTFFRISQASMEFVGLNLKAGKSVISDTIIFTYESQLALNNFVEEVTINAHLNNTLIFPEDLELFAHGAHIINKPMTVSGIVKGRVNKINLEQMDLSIGSTRLLGSLAMDGLPNLPETFIILNLRNSQFRFDDFDFLFKERILKRLEPVGELNLTGQFLGYPTDFVANGDIRTDLGRIKSDINFKIDEENFDKSNYAGHLSMFDFDLGRYSGDTVLFQKVSLEGKISGSGLTTETADFTLNGTISCLGIKGYNYSNIVSNARFASELFDGTLAINDPNLKFTTTGAVDLRKGKKTLQFQIALDTASFHKLNLTSKKIFLKTKLDIDIVGLSLDSLVGTANFKDFYIMYEDQDMALEDIHVLSKRNGRERQFELLTTLVDLKAEGNYQLTNLYYDLRKLSDEIMLNIRNDQEEIITYYKEKQRQPGNYKTNIEIKVNDIKPISELLALDFYVTPGTTVQGTYSSGYTTILQAYSFIDSLRYNGNFLYATNAEITASKIADSTSVLAMAYLESASQQFGKSLRTKNLISEGIWNKNHIDFEVNCDQQDQDNYVRVKGGVDFLRDSTLVSFEPSTLHLLQRDWVFNSSNKITLKKKNWVFEDVALINEGQSFQINGVITEDPEEKLTVEVSNLDLTILNVISPKKFTGILNGKVQLSQYFSSPSIENDIQIDSLTVNDFLVGDISGKNLWNNSEERFEINVFIDRIDKRIINLQGNYNPGADYPLNLTAEFAQANLKILEPFLDEIFSNMDGTVTGTYSITGKLMDPLIEGEAVVNRGQLMVQYTKALYQVAGVVGFRRNQIYFKNMDLTDTYKNKAVFSGTIYHKNFYSMSLDLKATMRSFQVLNTTAKDNSLFYGQGYATGEVSFTGPVENLTITSTAKTDKSTRIYIPISGTESSEKKDFINFINFTDTTFSLQNKKGNKRNNKKNLTGITFDLNLNVTPDAYCEIIIDLKAGDIIRGRGNGDLKIQLDTKGEFNMFGGIEFTEGWYNFTLYDIINKEFEIQKDSRITWYGDPYAANLNIKASYNQMASLSPLSTDPTISSSPELKRKYPIQVLLNLEGPMLSPQIVFDIIANDLPKSISAEASVSPDFLFQSFKNKLDEQGLKKQVFSLIVLRKFSPPESLDASGTLYNSVSELLSNQLSYWMSQVDNNLEIDLDLGTMDEEALNTFQLRLSYTFMNGRLRVTGDGTFGNSTYATQPDGKSNPNSVAGDWTVDYFLTADGKFKVRMYSRTNYNQLSTSLNNQSYMTTGVSLQHVQSFNEFKDLVNFKGRKKKEEERNRPDDSNPKSNAEGIKEEDGIY